LHAFNARNLASYLQQKPIQSLGSNGFLLLKDFTDEALWSFEIQKYFEIINLLRHLTGSGAHPAPCTEGTGGPFPGGKARPGRDADHPPPSSAEVKNE
jgi:hypothetical protein